MSIVNNINGELVEEVNSVISIKDRGLRFGDGVFESFRFYNRKILLENYMVNRLSLGLSAINIEYDLSLVLSAIEKTIEANGLDDGLGRVMITRGVGSRGYMPTYKSEPTFVVEVMAEIEMDIKDASLNIAGLRKIPQECLPVNYKLMQGLNSSLIKEKAKDDGFLDSIILSVDGDICETSSANIFWVDKDDIIHSPALESPCLKGTVREFVLRNFDVKSGIYKLEAIKNAKEVFITNIALKAQPVNLIGFGDGEEVQYMQRGVSEQVNEAVEKLVAELG